MIRRSALLVLEVTAGAIAGCLALGMIAAGLLLAKLSEEPLSVDFIRPYVEQALNDAGLGDSIRVERTALVWDGFGDAVELQAQNVAAIGADGFAQWSVDSLAVDFSANELLHGRLSPKRITLDGPHVAIIRTETGAFTLDIRPDDDAEDAADFGMTDMAWLRDLLSAPQTGRGARSAMDALNRVRIRNAEIEIDDRAFGIVWRAPQSEITLTRLPSGVVAEARLNLLIGAETSLVTAAATITPDRPELSATVVFSDIRPPALASLIPGLEELRRLRLPISGSVALNLDEDFAVQKVSADLSAASGFLDIPELYDAPVPVGMMQLSADLDPVARSLAVRDFFFDIRTMTATVNGSVAVAQGDDGEEIADIALAIEGGPVSLDDLDTLWPQKIPEGGRRWVTTRVLDGVIETVTGAARLSVPLSDPADSEIVSAGGRLTVSGATVEYMERMPKARDVAAIVDFDATSMDIALTDGRIFDARIAQGRARISGLMRPDQWIDIDLDLNAPFATAMRILDQPRLGYATALGLPPERLTGDAAVNLQFSFPLINRLTLDMVRIAGTAQLTDAGAESFVLARDLSEGDLSVTVDLNGLEVAGSARFDGVPSEFQWQQSFAEDAEIGTEVWATALVDDDDRARFGLAVPSSLVSGAGEIMIHYLAPRDEAARLELRADLTPIDIELWPIGYDKPAGRLAFARAALLLEDGNLRSVEDLRLWDDALTLQGSLFMATDDETGQTRLRRAFIERLVYGDTDAAIALDLSGEQQAGIGIRGRSLDLGPLLAGPPEPDGLEDAAPGIEGLDFLRVRSPTATPLTAFVIDMQVDRAFGGFGAGLTDLSGRIVYDGWRFREVVLRADDAAGALSFEFVPQDEAHRLTIMGQDAGAAASFLGLTDGIVGGTYTIDATTRFSENGPAVAGSFDIADFRAVDTPVLVRLINATTPAGIVDLLNREGIRFGGFGGAFKWQGDRLSIEEAQAVGSSIGLSVEGVADLGDDFIDLEGTVVPAYGINRVIGAIPLVGDIITGGDGQGLFGANYQVVGRLEDPDIRVNPLSALTPGLLRRIFFSGKSPGDRMAEREAEAGMVAEEMPAGDDAELPTENPASANEAESPPD